MLTGTVPAILILQSQLPFRHASRLGGGTRERLFTNFTRGFHPLNDWHSGT